MTTATEHNEETWSRGRSRLRFMLGEFSLFSWRFRALLYKKHFTASRQPADEVRPRFFDLPSELIAICMQSYPMQERQPRIAFLSDAIRYAPHRYRQYYIVLAGSFEQYLDRFTFKKRNLKRIVRRFEEASGGNIDFRTYAAPEEMPDFHRHALSISVRTYQHRLIDAGMPEGEEFTATLREAAAAGRAIGFVLFLSGAPVAYEYVTVEPGGIIITERTGYDPAHSRLAPGIVMLYCMIRDLFNARRFSILDFSGGEAEYKAMFSTHSAECGDMIYFRRSFGPTVAVCVHASLTTLNRGLARLLNAAQVKSRLKRYLRRSVEARPRGVSAQSEPSVKAKRATGATGAPPAA